MSDSPQHWGFLPHVVELAATHRLPASYPYREFAERGGLMAYAADLHEFNRVQARIVNRVLRGEKPAEIPFEQPNAFIFVINAKTANTLRLTIPPTLLARADEVIE
jgi:putative ABC transport system substrate-binding protein